MGKVCVVICCLLITGCHRQFPVSKMDPNESWGMIAWDWELPTGRVRLAAKIDLVVDENETIHFRLEKTDEDGRCLARNFQVQRHSDLSKYSANFIHETRLRYRWAFVPLKNLTLPCELPNMVSTTISSSFYEDLILSKNWFLRLLNLYMLSRSQALRFSFVPNGVNLGTRSVLLENLRSGEVWPIAVVLDVKQTRKRRVGDS